MLQFDERFPGVIKNPDFLYTFTYAQALEKMGMSILCTFANCLQKVSSIISCYKNQVVNVAKLNLRRLYSNFPDRNRCKRDSSFSEVTTVASFGPNSAIHLNTLGPFNSNGKFFFFESGIYNRISSAQDFDCFIFQTIKKLQRCWDLKSKKNAGHDEWDYIFLKTAHRSHSHEMAVTNVFDSGW